MDSASGFGRWLQFSGIITLCKENATAPGELLPLKIDGAFLEHQCKELISICNDFYRTNGSTSRIGASELETLHEKVKLGLKPGLRRWISVRKDHCPRTRKKAAGFVSERFVLLKLVVTISLHAVAGKTTVRCTT